MTEIHIPDEVVEAAHRAYVSAGGDNQRQWMTAAITAALEAWPKTGMAREAKGYMYALPNVIPPQWEAYTNPNFEMTDDPSFQVIMIRTEAP